ncbi:DUF2017 domain-containing protein [Actinorugispora endophytica]|uniref:Uncharacterized protein DUF2017 n=1 Tax=Actinorugispora endophytica TaxID=1605990 RepID=A0A4R6UH22_9ACTN|nr:DUF2017 domain-containing protein [Actinorugispora endophytica]TDQ44579.1 uncharacterized protein DUF2017 [Actinorugispora endophytica]
MTTGFHSAPRGGVRIEVDSGEASLLRSMAALVLQLVEAPEPQDEFAALIGIGANSTRPEDPVLARLFPDAYTEDALAAGDFRRYTEDGLRRHKRENAQLVFDGIPAGGGEITLDLADAHSWLKLLTDVRLSLGTRLGIEDEADLEALRQRLRGDESLASAAHIYEWLTHLQESLVQALMRD